MNELSRSPRRDRDDSSPTQTRCVRESGQCVTGSIFLDDYLSHGIA